MIQSRLALIFLTLFCANQAMASLSSEMIETKGFRLPLETFSKNYLVMNLVPTSDLLKNHIVKINGRVPPAEALAISKNILKISACMQIDPWILTALIQHESTFNKNAVSPTGAAGLTQFTSIAFQEVNDQLGLRGRAGAPEITTLFLAEKIRTCIDPSWIDLWNRVEAKEDEPEFYPQLKEVVKQDIKSSIVYGAILLKTYLAVTNKRQSPESKPLKMSEIYFHALQIYNGEAGEAKVKFAKKVFSNLKSVYPAEVNFPFLD